MVSHSRRPAEVAETRRRSGDGSRAPWRPMRIFRIGSFVQLVQAGRGKISATFGDVDTRKGQGTG